MNEQDFSGLFWIARPQGCGMCPENISETLTPALLLVLELVFPLRLMVQVLLVTRNGVLLNTGPYLDSWAYRTGKGESSLQQRCFCSNSPVTVEGSWQLAKKNIVEKGVRTEEISMPWTFG